MSRHRAVRNIALNDIYIEEDDYVDDQEFLDELEGATDEQKAQLESGVEALREKLEKKFIINDNEIKKALWDTYFDEAEAMKWLKKTLKPKTTKSKGEMDIQDGEDEDSELEAGDSGKRSDAKPLGSKGTFGSLKSLSMMTNGMSSLSIGPKLGTTLLSPKSNQSEHIPKSSAIQGKGIGPLSKGGKPLASLSSLASKGNNTSGPSLGSLSNTSKTSKPLNTSLTRNASEKPVSLSTLAGSQVNKTATVDSSGNHINNALRALRSKSTVSQHTQIEGSIAMSIPLSRGTLPEFTKVRKPASVYPKVHHKSNTIELDIDPAAPPSLFADFIFSSLYGNQVLGHKQDSITSANWLSMLLSQQQPPTDPSAVLNSQNQHENEYCFNRNNYRNDCGTYPNLSFLRAVGNSGASTPKGSKGAKPQGQKAKSAVKPFGFDKPSPDDVVIAAQQRADHKDGAGGAGKTKAGK
ncbi:hypothetical protein H4219_001118 [Mycoemilia scoparia]|uniref:HBS1-like protein N-terminal domain-containing protein n=1 Tax=Mycoemilia scoparia TaxID=417184 RepID=A0A9W8A5F7_9FUNG|nr:hypothetical protein H4219_001118 [Mycoemilia scoparia]